MKQNSSFLTLLFTLLVVSIIFPATLLYAGTTGKIRGVVVDAETNDPLPGVNVIIVGTTMGASTDVNGEYIILNVPPGEYELEARMMGYKRVVVENVKVATDYTTKINFELPPTVLDLGESVTVTAEKPIVRKDLTSTTAIVSSEDIEEMPVEEFSDILMTKAGVVRGANNTMHIRGGRSSEVGFMIDGVSVSNPFWGGSVLEVENSSIKELQVISGTFNAEYGQAMSGIVNIVTKEGSNKFNGKISAYAGDYYSTKTNKFFHIDEFKILNFKNMDFSLSGPVPLLGNRIKFFATGRYYNNDGYLYGIREHTPTDSVNRTAPHREDWYIEKGGDSTIVPMNPYQKLSGQFKLTYRPFNNTKLVYNFIGDTKDYKTYTHSFKYNPDGDYNHYRWSSNHSFTLTQTMSPKTFFDFKLAYTLDKYKEYVYEDPYDSRYVDDTRYLRTDGQTGFYLNGQGMWHYIQNFKTYITKLDLTSQVHSSHEVKLGFLYRYYDLHKHDYKTVMEEWTNWEPVVLDPLEGTSTNEYTRHPQEIAFYIQDKIEFRSMILRAGLRYEYFDPAAEIPADPEDPNLRMSEERDYHAIKTKQADVKHQFSPRLGFAYPITDRGAIHFSYGHFFQIPPFAYLYSNPEWEVTPGYLNTLMGNPDLKPQRTVIYEIGLQQQLTENIGVDVTGFYKDINNLLSSGLSSGLKYYELPGGTFYSRYANEDYANVKGITITLNKRYSNYVSGSIDYSFLVAEGNASSPTAAFYDVQAGREPQKKVVPLNWDQTHTLNLNLIFSQRDNWAVSIIGRLESGFPYTPSPERLRGLGMGQEQPQENSGRKPSQYTFDLSASKDFLIGGLKYTIFMKIYNMFDRANERYVYNDTGRAGYSIVAQRLPDFSDHHEGIYSIDDYYNRPWYYREPREIRFGMRLEF